MNISKGSASWPARYTSNKPIFLCNEKLKFCGVLIWLKWLDSAGKIILSGRLCVDLCCKVFVFSCFFSGRMMEWSQILRVTSVRGQLCVIEILFLLIWFKLWLWNHFELVYSLFLQKHLKKFQSRGTSFSMRLQNESSWEFLMNFHFLKSQIKIWVNTHPLNRARSQECLFRRDSSPCKQSSYWADLDPVDGRLIFWNILRDKLSR